MRQEYLSTGLALIAAGLLLATVLGSTARRPTAVLPAAGVPTRLDVAARSAIPIGAATALGNGWRLTVLEAVPDAGPAVLAASTFNAPPAPGAQFFMVRVAAAYHGAAACGCDSFTAPSPFTLRARGASGQVYTTFRQETSCGLEIPGGLPPVLSKGGAPENPAIAGNVCWQVASADADQLLLFYEPLYLSEATAPARYFATYPAS
jgi:hypothetical protein